ncbi:MAG TPA: inactive serine/threonine-protein kinase VRK3, partial [Ktedonobacterales bacterium]|nr:inactive serine/threonine-protein kinase VRK3 [Ktedonobacterales bacterium]
MAGKAGAMIACPYCKTQNRPDAIFCDTCGGALTATAGPAQGGVAARRPLATGQLPSQTMLAGRYLIMQRVGQGGMAAVYRGTDTKRNRTVAIKEMSQEGLSPNEIREAIASFQSEADLLVKLDHPNLPKFYQQFSENARHYLVMEFVEGKTLEQIQAGDYKGGIVSEARVIAWAEQLCDALG